MTPGAKILVAAAILCLILWFALTGLGVQPLAVDRLPEVIYGVGEDFYSDATVYRKLRNDRLLIIHLPRARPENRWVSVDFESMTIAFTGSPRSLGSLKYLLKNDEQGTRISEQESAGSWYWHFTDQGASFSGNDFSCRVRRIQK
ncbi:MAG: hypothetical protein OEW15_17065 [Nitrospirota bacterium]|nr:hypothetical protein [Nitrospirota bacterium]